MLKPIYDKVIVKRVDMEEKTSSGIILAEKSKEKSNEVIVIAVGEGRLLPDNTYQPLKVAVGNRLLLRRGTGIEVVLEKEEYLVITESDVLGIYE